MSPRADSEIEDDYKERYVAYLDLLGFKAEVEGAERDPAKRARLREILGLVRNSLCENPALGMRLTYFSDCIVFSADRTDQGLWEVFQSIDILTFNLLQYDVFVRGGLVSGGAHHGRDFVYGTAVNRAYMLESQWAKGPMTLISQEVFDDAKTYGEGFVQWIREDSPMRYFVHYLRRYAEYRPEPHYAGDVIMDDPGPRIVGFVYQRLNTSTGGVLAKAQWLQNYWNRTVAVDGVFDSIESGVSPRFVSRGPTIMMRRIAGPRRLTV